MKYQKFEKIWDKYMPRDLVMVANPDTIQALIEYGRGNKTKVNKIKKLLNAPLT